MRSFSNEVWLKVRFVDELLKPSVSRERRDEWLSESWKANKRFVRGALKAGLFIALPIFLLWLVLWPAPSGIRISAHNAWMQQTHVLGLAMFSYANDHNGVYPTGGSSTEAFQRLLDGAYVTDPAIFYIPMAGKVPPVAGQKLKPENVSYDVTGDVGPGDSDLIPLVFTTGYRVTYAPGAAAVPIIKPFPNYEQHWFLFSWAWAWGGLKNSILPGAGVYYKDNAAVWIILQGDSIHNFVFAKFDAKGKTYRQLTPEGVLAPETK